jgi:hypothetical protein
MKIKQYNFIRGGSVSGKTLFTQKLIHCLGNKTIYYNLDGSNLFDVTQKNGKQFTITMQNPTFGKILRDIKTFNENLYEMWNIVIDPITVLPSQKDDFYMFVQSLPKNHRYFFTTQIHPNSIDDYSNIECRNETLRDYRDSFLLPDNSISIFNTYKNGNDILAYNYNTNESYNLGDVAQIIRDIKINEVLSV